MDLIKNRLSLSKTANSLTDKDFAASPEIFKLLVDAIKEYAIFALDTQGRILTWNKGAERLKGYRADEIIGRHFSRFYTPEDLERNHPEFELSIAAHKGMYEEEGWRVRKDGSKFWASVMISALRDPNGELCGFGKVTRDLSQKRRAELALRRSEERFRLMVDSVQEYAIFMLDPKGFVTTWNKGAERNKGYRAEEIIGKHFSEFYPKDDRLKGKPERQLGEAVEFGRVEDEGWRVRKDGTQFWAHGLITPLYDEEQKLIGFCKVTRNLTERKNAEDALRESYANLEQRITLRTKELEEAKRRAELAVSERDRFFSIASHELKTPLFSLKLQSQIRQKCLDKGDLSNFTPPALQSLFAEDNVQIDRLSSLVDRMLDLSRIISGRMHLTKEAVELKPLLEKIIQGTTSILAETGTKIFLNCPENIIGTWDRGRIEQVFTNLLTNAGKYAATKPVIITAERTADSVTIAVQDFGPGIADENKTRIFAPFERIESSTQTQGLGLGLHICKCIIEEHRGTISVNSLLGQGSVFKVELPLTSTDQV